MTDMEMNRAKNPELLYIFRKPQASYFSLERVFNQVAREMKKHWRVESFSVPHARPRPWNILLNSFAARWQRADIYHVTGDVHYVSLALPGKRTILTMHDLAVMHRKTGLRRLFFKYLYLVWPVRHCRFITCISEKTREDIIRFTGCAPDRVVVIPNPVDEYFQDSPRVFQQDYPVLLFLGTAPHKNLSRTLDAIRDMPCRLEIVGRIPEEERRKLLENKIDFRESYDLSDEELVQKYRDCDIVLFPSLFEGFGLPIIEGQQSGRPVLSSNRSPMKEVAGEGACLVNPEDADSIREGLQRLIHDEAFRTDILAKARLNIVRFKAERIATQYEALYQEIMDDEPQSRHSDCCI